MLTHSTDTPGDGAVEPEGVVYTLVQLSHGSISLLLSTRQGEKGFKHMLSEDNFMQYQHEPDLLSPRIAVCLLIYRLYLVSLARRVDVILTFPSTWCNEIETYVEVGT